MQVHVIFEESAHGIGYFFVAQGFWKVEDLTAD
jgi:hypothetical protein